MSLVKAGPLDPLELAYVPNIKTPCLILRVKDIAKCLLVRYYKSVSSDGVAPDTSSGALI